MSETDRVQRWRDAKRQKGLKACTVWLSVEEELLLKDYAAKGRCSPSEIMQRALAQYQPAKQSSISNISDAELLREMIREEMSTLKAASATVTVTDIEQLRALIQDELAASSVVTASVTDAVTDTLPAMVRAIVEELALGTLGLPGTATSNSYIADIDWHEQATESPHANVADTNGNVTETEQPAAAPRKGGRTSTLRQPIVDLLRAHPEGLTASQIKVYLNLERNVGDLLQGMSRDHVISKQGTGAQVRYRVASAPAAPPAPPAAPAPARRTTRTAQRV